MKKILKIIAIVLAIIIAAVIILALWLNFSSERTYPTEQAQLTASPDSMSLQRGIKMVNHYCTICHLGSDGKLSGTLFSAADEPFGTIYSRNLTNHATAGLGKYSDGELFYLLRTGIMRDGHFAGPYMSKPKLSDEDLVSIVKFLRSDDPLVSASSVTHPKPEFSFLAKALKKLGAMAPEKYSAAKIETPSSNDTKAFGKYLATHVYECFNCHSASFETNNATEPEKSVGYFGGGNLIVLPKVGSLVSPNITMHMEDGIGKYNEAEFAKMVRNGVRPDQNKMTSLMPKFSMLSDDEIHAIWEYLKTVPILEKN